MFTRWPPNKAWTSTSSRNGFRHFVAINYGGKGPRRWVNLISVLDDEITIKVSFDELNDISKWTPGWLQIKRDEANCPQGGTIKQETLIESQSCLHPSLDSGFLIPTDSKLIREWE